MTELVTAALVAGVAYLATNFENLLLLLGLMAASGAKPWEIGFGYVLSVVVVVALSLGLGVVLGLMEVGQLRWLGLVPLGAGVFLAVRALLLRKGVVVEVPSGRLAVMASFGISLVHSADSLMVYGPLFAETKGADRVVMTVTMVLLSIGGVFAARHLVRRPKLGACLRRVAPVAVPLFLIAVGIYVLMDSPTDLQG